MIKFFLLSTAILMASDHTSNAADPLEALAPPVTATATPLGDTKAPPALTVAEVPEKKQVAEAEKQPIVLAPPSPIITGPQAQAASAAASSLSSSSPQAVKLNLQGYPIGFEKFDPLGDGNCWMWAIGIPVETCEMGGKYPDEIIKIAKKYKRSVTVWVDPRSRSVMVHDDESSKMIPHNLYEDKYVHIEPGSTMTHLFYTQTLSGYGHFLLLVDPNSPNAGAERKRGERLEAFKGYTSGTFGKPEQQKAMLEKPDYWQFAKTPPAVPNATAVAATPGLSPKEYGPYGTAPGQKLAYNFSHFRPMLPSNTAATSSGSHPTSFSVYHDPWGGFSSPLPTTAAAASSGIPTRQPVASEGTQREIALQQEVAILTAELRDTRLQLSNVRLELEMAKLQIARLRQGSLTSAAAAVQVVAETPEAEFKRLRAKLENDHEDVQKELNQKYPSSAADLFDTLFANDLEQYKIFRPS